MVPRIETTGRIGRRRLLQGMGAAGFAVVFASACRSGSEGASTTTATAGSSDAAAGPEPAAASSITSVVSGAETAVTTMPAGTSPFDDYRYENAETGTWVRIWVDGDTRYIEANGLPDHATGAFPNANNPNAAGRYPQLSG